MTCHQTNERDLFEVDKAIAALAYLVEATSESMYSILKMMYLADKLHLQRYGRFIAGDRYCALKQGPVPSNAYAIFQHVRGDNWKEAFTGADRFFEYHADHHITLKQRPDFDELSVGEHDCLTAIIRTYQNVGKWAVRDLSHDEAWQTAWGSRSRFFRKSVRIKTEEIAKQFENAEDVLDHLQDAHPGEAELPAGFEHLDRVRITRAA